MNPSITANDTASNLKNATRNFREGANNVADAAQDANRELRDTANMVGHKVRDFVDTANDELTHATKAVTTHIHEKPVQSSLIALGLGYVLAALIRR